jgi:hypothetical protein
MQLREIELTKIFKQEFATAQRILRAAGWQVLGSGVEGAVAMHPRREYVLKLFDSDSPYKYFVGYAQQHKENPHLPRFSRYVRPVPGTNWSYVRMEELKPLGASFDTAREYLMMFYPGEAWYMRYVELITNKDLNAGLDKLDDKILVDQIEAIKKGNLSYLDLCKLLRIRPADNQWQLAITDIVHHKWGYFDIHPRNMMLRGETLVITDPVCMD